MGESLLNSPLVTKKLVRHPFPRVLSVLHIPNKQKQMAAASFLKFSFMSISLFSVLLLIHAPHSSSVSFSFNFSNSAGDPCDAELRCEHDTRMGPGFLELTKNEKLGDPFSVGRASYACPVALWDSSTGEVASFTSNFTFQIKPKNETTYQACNRTGDGMAFFLAHYPSKIPRNSFGMNLALFNDSNNNNATGADRVVAVEFDTAFNSNQWDKTPYHVGIDVNSMDSKANVNVTKGLVFEEAIMTAKISYNNLTGNLTAHLQIDDGEPYIVFYPVDMKVNLPEEVAVGLSAATGYCIELHQVMSWSFNSTLELGATGGRRRWRRLLPVLVPTIVVAFLALLVCAAVGFVVRQRRIWKKLHEDDSDGEHEQAEFEGGVGPRRYRYHELAAATSSFAEEEKLGRGGFGNVYRGRSLGDQDRAVAIKMFLAAESSAQGRKEFEAEVKIISRLRHRNLVQLLGWCDSRKGLLLVYELVPEGSLDRHLYNDNSLLSWPERYKIILGLGSALRYLHTEWDQCVLHGDIKPSNILLDSSHSTKLGDFGLARLVDHGAGPRTTQVVMGTAGYIDPEFIRTRRPSVESDVYSFGVVLLEIVTGRRPEMEHPDKVIPLLKWIWDLYDRNALLEAVDRSLLTQQGKLQLEDGGCEWQLQRVLVVGLWCAHPEPGVRPSIVQAMNVLQSEDVTLPVLSRQEYTSDFSREARGGYNSPGTGNMYGDYHSPATGNVSAGDVSWALSGGR